MFWAGTMACYPVVPSFALQPIMMTSFQQLLAEVQSPDDLVVWARDGEGRCKVTALRELRLAAVIFARHIGYGSDSEKLLLASYGECVEDEAEHRYRYVSLLELAQRFGHHDLVARLQHPWHQYQILQQQQRIQQLQHQQQQEQNQQQHQRQCQVAPSCLVGPRTFMHADINQQGNRCEREEVVHAWPQLQHTLHRQQRLLQQQDSAAHKQLLRDQAELSTGDIAFASEQGRPQRRRPQPQQQVQKQKQYQQQHLPQQQQQHQQQQESQQHHRPLQMQQSVNVTAAGTVSNDAAASAAVNLEEQLSAQQWWSHELRALTRRFGAALARYISRPGGGAVLEIDLQVILGSVSGYGLPRGGAALLIIVPANYPWAIPIFMPVDRAGLLSHKELTILGKCAANAAAQAQRFGGPAVLFAADCAASMLLQLLPKASTDARQNEASSARSDKALLADSGNKSPIGTDLSGPDQRRAYATGITAELLKAAEQLTPRRKKGNGGGASAMDVTPDKAEMGMRRQKAKSNCTTTAPVTPSTSSHETPDAYKVVSASSTPSRISDVVHIPQWPWQDPSATKAGHVTNATAAVASAAAASMQPRGADAGTAGDWHGMQIQQKLRHQPWQPLPPFPGQHASLREVTGNAYGNTSSLRPRTNSKLSSNLETRCSGSAGNVDDRSSDSESDSSDWSSSSSDDSTDYGELTTISSQLQANIQRQLLAKQEAPEKRSKTARPQRPAAKRLPSTRF